jgi:Fe-S cluster assembly iron-binding protein IscA
MGHLYTINYQVKNPDLDDGAFEDKQHSVVVQERSATRALTEAVVDFESDTIRFMSMFYKGLVEVEAE